MPDLIDFGWLDDILAGIDCDDLDRPHGWWATSTGAAFGARKLAEVKAAITTRYHPGDRGA